MVAYDATVFTALLLSYRRLLVEMARHPWESGPFLVLAMASVSTATYGRSDTGNGASHRTVVSGTAVGRATSGRIRGAAPRPSRNPRDRGPTSARTRLTWCVPGQAPGAGQPPGTGGSAKFLDVTVPGAYWFFTRPACSAAKVSSFAFPVTVRPTSRW